MHELKALDDFLGVPKRSQGPDSHDNNSEAKTDIYNYAARFGCVPKLHARMINRGGRKTIEVIAKLVEQDIHVVARGSNLLAAEIAAASRFKRAAETYHVKEGKGPIVIKESTAITATNSRKFFEYLKYVHPTVKYTVSSEPAEERRGMGQIPIKAQVMIDGEPIGEAVEFLSKKKAEDLAFLTAAVVLLRKDPGLEQGFFQALQTGNGDILRRVSPITMPVDEDCLLEMRETLFSARNAGLPDKVDELMSEETDFITNDRTVSNDLTSEAAAMRNRDMQNSMNTFSQDDRLKDLRTKRSALPINHYRTEVVDMVSKNPYSIIVGATGSGKSTQVPQILLENAISNGIGSECNILCTQPRRIAATSVARRVSEERAESLRETVGYIVRFDSQPPVSRGSITYCTTGILLAQLQFAPDAVMREVSHIVIDEVHERDINIDFLLVILKRIIFERTKAGLPTPKVVLMSATIDTNLFASYFRNNLREGNVEECPTLRVPGRNFPVEERYLDQILNELQTSQNPSVLQIFNRDIATQSYLEDAARFSREQQTRNAVDSPSNSQDNDFIIDWKKEHRISEDGEVIDVKNEVGETLVPHGLIAATIAHVALTTHNGAILAFLPGLDDIIKVDELLRGSTIPGVDFNERHRFKIYVLHSAIPGSQSEVFEQVQPGCRKIILATNIAETSITIPEVQYVVDSGKQREKQYDPSRRITQLCCKWISKSNSKQRAGRAGRVQKGNYYALFPKARYDAMRAIGVPEMHRSELQEICLRVKAQALGIPIRDFLAEAIEPPSPKAVDMSVKSLQALDALTKDESLTQLGRLLASLPIHPSLGKMIVLGVLFRCLDPMLIISAASNERDMFMAPLAARSQAHRAKASFVENSASDHVAILNAVREIRDRRSLMGDRGARNFAMNNFINYATFKQIDLTARQITELLVKSGLIPSPPLGPNPHIGPPSLNENSRNIPLIKALALSGLQPSLAIATGGRTLRAPGENNVMLHLSSVNACREKDDLLSINQLFTYTAMSRSADGRTIFLRDTSKSTPLMATLFGAGLVQQGRVLEVNGWLPLFVSSTDSRAAKTIIEFRKALDRLLADAFRDLKARKNPEREFLADEQVRKIFAEGLVAVLMRDVKADKDHSQTDRRVRNDPLAPLAQLGLRARSDWRAQSDWRAGNHGTSTSGSAGRRDEGHRRRDDSKVRLNHEIDW